MFIEEMMAGQKVIKAFVHEAASIEAFHLKLTSNSSNLSYLSNCFNVPYANLGNL